MTMRRNANALFGLLLALACFPGWLNAQEKPGKPGELEQLKTKVRQLEQRVAELEKLINPVKGRFQAESRRKALSKKAAERMREDLKTYTQAQLQQIETLYQLAARDLSSPKAKKNLEKLVKKYPAANRSGCAVLYLAQMAKKGEVRQKYLKAAISKHGDCWYRNGVQVGAYARLYLAAYYGQTGRKAAAEKLFAELREKYPEAIDHQGRLLTDIIPPEDTKKEQHGI